MRDIFKTTPLTPPEKSNLLMWHGGYQGGRVFHNDGTDYVDCGRPSWIGSIVPGSTSFTSESTVIINSDTGTYQALFLYGNASERTFGIALNYTAGAIVVYKGGGVAITSVTLPPLKTIFNAIVSISATNDYKVFIDSQEVASGTIADTLVTTANLFIMGGLGGSSTFNVQGDCIKTTFYSGYTDDGNLSGLTLLDSYDFGDTNQWDGGTNGTSLKGNPFTRTDGTPTDAGDYAYSKELFTNNYAMYQYSTGNINPNPTGDATLTGLGFTNSYMTKASLSALHNGTTIFVSDASATLFRMLVYSALTDTQKALDYVRR